MLAKTYRIETERLVIRCYEPKDAQLLQTAITESLEHLREWMPWTKHEPESVEVKAERLRTFRGNFDLGIDYTFGIFSKDETCVIGSTGLHTRAGANAREIGYWIGINHIQQGYATEAVKALLKVGFEIEQLDRIEIRCSPDNIASQKIPENLGFTHEATLRKRVETIYGTWQDSMVWTMFRDEYEQYFAEEYPQFYLHAFGADGGRVVQSNHHS